MLTFIPTPTSAAALICKQGVLVMVFASSGVPVNAVFSKFDRYAGFGRADKRTKMKDLYSNDARGLSILFFFFQT